MRILIIGGTGFIGPFVVKNLVEQGHDVLVFHRGKSEADLPPSVQHIRCGDAEPPYIGWKEQLLPRFLSELRTFAPDVTLDMMSLTEREARAVVQVCRECTRRFVTISSGDVYRAYGRLSRTEPGLPDPTPLTEDAPLREKLYPYRETASDGIFRDYDKIPVERVFLEDPDVPGTALRLPAVYGPRDNQHRLFDVLKRIDDGRSAILLGESLADWHWTRGYVENIAVGIALATTSEHAANRIYNLGESRTLSMKEWTQAIGDAAGWQGKIILVPDERLPEFLQMPLDTSQDLQVDTTRIRQELGYSEPFSLEESLHRTIAWERTHPPEQIDPKRFDYAAEDALLATL